MSNRSVRSSKFFEKPWDLFYKYPLKAQKNRLQARPTTAGIAVRKRRRFPYMANTVLPRDPSVDNALSLVRYQYTAHDLDGAAFTLRSVRCSRSSPRRSLEKTHDPTLLYTNILCRTGLLRSLKPAFFLAILKVLQILVSSIMTPFQPSISF